jgi:SecD/SecF fusion protein
MVEYPWRRLSLILILLVAGLTSLFVNGLQLGLDLQGGSRLVYRIDLEQAVRDGVIDENADTDEVMAETLGILAQRIDPQGILEASITLAGSDRIMIELPGKSKANLLQVRSRIEQLGSLEMRMVAYADYEGWPGQSEELDGKPFEDLEVEKTRLKTWLAKPENKELVELNPKAINKFNQDPVNGPLAEHLWWFPMYREESAAWKQLSEEERKANPNNPIRWQYEQHSLAVENFLPVNMHEEHFRGEDLDAKTLAETADESGFPALGYRIKAEKVGPYENWSERNIGKCSAIILNGEVRLAPVFRSMITGGRGQISGIGTSADVNNLVKVLKTGALEIIPILDSETTVGASLGQIAIEKGEFSMILGAVLILVFMIGYYKFAGSIAILALLMNVAFVFGILAFVKATLTLPGLAGIVLTIGMAVDANILIFERIREEMGEGKDLKHSVEAGFEKALSTILDANITTFLTGLILYWVGIGPIKGFAVTLMIGIVTSVFSALYGSKLLFHFAVSRGLTDLNMRQLFKRPHFRFLKLRMITTTLSVILVLTGLTIFFTTDNATKYGLDFTGGAAVRVALSEQMKQADIVKLLQDDEAFKNEFGSAQVTTLGETDREFQIKIKLNAEQRDRFQKQQEEANRRRETWTPPFVSELERLLEGKLANSPFTILSTPTDIGTGTIVEVALNSTSPVQISDIKEKLAIFKIGKVEGYNENGERDPDLEVAKRVFLDLTMEPLGVDELDQLEEAVTAFKKRLPGTLREQLAGLQDANGDDLVLSSPFPETELIGSRAVGDLQGAAILSVLISIGGILLYIRVRFHEFKYGIGACVALVHDVSIVLGLVVLGNAIGIVHAEIDLSMIAAFLTIIGYSLNDTIVVFDRIRENLELKRKYGEEIHFEELVDSSVNQTLSRTVLTSLTTFFVILSILVFNHGAGSVLEGFSFAMLGGILVGTYSSIWVANPVVVWLTKRDLRQGKDYYSAGEQVDGNVQEGIV